MFNVPETILPKIIPPQPEKNTPSPRTSKDKKANKQDELTQTLFDYMIEDIHTISLGSTLFASTSGTSETSESPKLVIDKPEVNELPKTNEPISKITNTPPKEISVKRDLPKLNEVSSAILLSRVQ